MHVKLEQWKDGWSGLQMGMSEREISRLIELLEVLKADPEQHFHITSDTKGQPGIGGIEIYVKAPDEMDNMSLSTRALGPGDEI